MTDEKRTDEEIVRDAIMELLTLHVGQVKRLQGLIRSNNEMINALTDMVEAQQSEIDSLRSQIMG